MARLEIKLDGKDIGADKALLTARITLKMLRAIEKEITGKRPTAPWKVDIFSCSREVIVVIRMEPPSDKKKDAAFDIAELILAKL